MSPDQEPSLSTVNGRMPTFRRVPIDILLERALHYHKLANWVREFESVADVAMAGAGPIIGLIYGVTRWPPLGTSLGIAPVMTTVVGAVVGLTLRSYFGEPILKFLKGVQERLMQPMQIYQEAARLGIVCNGCAYPMIGLEGLRECPECGFSDNPVHEEP